MLDIGIPFARLFLLLYLVLTIGFRYEDSETIKRQKYSAGKIFEKLVNAALDSCGLSTVFCHNTYLYLTFYCFFAIGILFLDIN